MYICLSLPDFPFDVTKVTNQDVESLPIPRGHEGGPDGPGKWNKNHLSIILIKDIFYTFKSKGNCLIGQTHLFVL